MKQPVRAKDVLILVGVALAWTLVVIAFSTTMGSRPLRIYDWGPPVLAAVLTLVCMLRDRMAPRGGGE
jgi:hypothetical protein